MSSVFYPVSHSGNVLQELVHACALGGAILVKAHKRIYFFCRQMAYDGWRLASQLAHRQLTKLKIHVIYPSAASLVKAAKLCRGTISKWSGH